MAELIHGQVGRRAAVRDREGGGGVDGERHVEAEVAAVGSSSRGTGPQYTTSRGSASWLLGVVVVNALNEVWSAPARPAGVSSGTLDMPAARSNTHRCPLGVQQ
jgi:hypothetical protein